MNFSPAQVSILLNTNGQGAVQALNKTLKVQGISKNRCFYSKEWMTLGKVVSQF
jgi:hypothetical protein